MASTSTSSLVSDYQVPVDVLENIQARYLEALEKQVKMTLKAIVAHLGLEDEDKKFVTAQFKSLSGTMASELAIIESKFVPRGQPPIRSKKHLKDAKVDVPISNNVVRKVKAAEGEMPPKKAAPKKTAKTTSKTTAVKQVKVPSDEALKEMDRKALEECIAALHVEVPDKATLAKIRSALKKKRDELELEGDLARTKTLLKELGIKKADVKTVAKADTKKKDAFDLAKLKKALPKTSQKTK